MMISKFPWNLLWDIGTSHQKCTNSLGIPSGSKDNESPAESPQFVEIGSVESSEEWLSLPLKGQMGHENRCDTFSKQMAIFHSKTATLPVESVEYDKIWIAVDMMWIAVAIWYVNIMADIIHIYI